MSLSRSLSKYAAIGALVYLVTGTALAQEDAEPALEEVTITGSRIARRDFVAVSPVATVSRESIDATGAATIETALNQLPQFGLGGSSSSAGFSGTGLATLNLRGLGASRNLVLVDGHRVQPSTILQAVDVNTVPKSLIENVEIISGGASAVYGSDAISGVVNIKTIPRFEGIRFDSQYNFLENGEGGETTELGVTLGSNFLGERGNAVLALSWTDREEVPFQSLEFFQQAQGGTDFRLPTGIYSPGRSTPSQAAVDQVFAQYGAAPGRVPAGSRIGFNDDGTIFSASNGPLNYRGPSTLLFDTGSQLNNLNQFSIVQVPLERYAAFGRGSFELAPSVTAFARVNYSTHETLTLAEAGNNAITIPVTHPFIPGDLATLLASRADPTAPFVLDKRYQEAGPRTFNRDFDVYQLAAGLTGKAGGLASSWEVFASRGSTELLETNEGAVLISSLTALINAADGGAGVCAGGYNPFGMGTLSDSCRSFLVGTPKSRTTIDQDVW